MNRVNLIGRPTKDPDLRYTQSGTAVCSFTLAVDRQFKNKETGKKEADFIPVKVWNKAAENVANFVTKGNLIAVCGRIQTGSYEKDDGTRVYTTDVMADEVQFLETKKNNQSNEQNNSNESSNQSSQSASDNGFIPIDNDDDIPF